MRLKVMPTVAVPLPADLGEQHKERYVAMVRLATLLVGSQATAEEVVQDSFVRLHARLDAVDDPAAYLRTAVVDGCRSAARHRAVEAPPDGILGALARLPARRRAALVLRFYEGLSAAQIARCLNCRPATVKSSIRRGLAQLAKASEP